MRANVKMHASSIAGLCFGIASIFLLFPGLSFAVVPVAIVDPDPKDGNGVSVYNSCTNICSGLTNLPYEEDFDRATKESLCRSDCMIQYAQHVCPSGGKTVIVGSTYQCTSNDQICQNLFGEPYAWNGAFNAAGKPMCGCKEGSTMNYKSQCVTNDQYCKNDYGDSSNWSGNIKNDGTVMCGCVQGYSWNSEGTACVAQQVQQSAPATGTMCNGKSWGACPLFKKFYCPPTGDPQCLGNPAANANSIGSSVGGAGSGGGSGVATRVPAKQPVVSVPRPSPASQITHEAESTTEAKGTTTITGTDNGATTTPKHYRGLKRFVQDLWSWAVGLLSF